LRHDVLGAHIRYGARVLRAVRAIVRGGLGLRLSFFYLACLARLPSAPLDERRERAAGLDPGCTPLRPRRARPFGAHGQRTWNDSAHNRIRARTIGDARERDVAGVLDPATQILEAHRREDAGNA